MGNLDDALGVGLSGSVARATGRALGVVVKGTIAVEVGKAVL